MSTVKRECPEQMAYEKQLLFGFANYLRMMDTHLPVCCLDELVTLSAPEHPTSPQPQPHCCVDYRADSPVPRWETRHCAD